MRRKRNSRVLAWPLLGATAVTLILTAATVLRGPSVWSGVRLTSHAQGNAASGQSAHGGSAPHGRVRTVHPLALDAMEAQGTHRGSAGRVAPQDQRLLRPHHTRPTPLATETYLVPQGSGGATIRVLAPVRDGRAEMAGHTDGKFPKLHPSQVASWGPNDATILGAAVRSGANPSRSERPVTIDREALSVGSPETAPSDSLLYRPSDGSRLLLDNHSVSGPTIDAQWEWSGERSGDKAAGIAWPRTPALDASLVQLRRWPMTSRWTARVRETLAALQAIPAITDSRAGVLIASLDDLAIAGVETGEAAIADRALQEAMLRTSYALLRRTAVWRSVWQLSAEQDHATAAPQVRDEAIQPIVNAVRKHALVTGDVDGWNRYLLLDEIQRLADQPGVQDRRLTAQRLLSRVQWEGLREDQKQWLEDESLQALLGRIRPWADTPIDYAALLAQIERQEADAIDLGGIRVATAVQDLRFSEHPRAVRVAEAVNTGYRNANMRLAISAELIERLLPAVPERSTDIRHSIAGTPIRGRGVVDSTLGIQLIPTSGAWHLQLRTIGTVTAHTQARRWPVTVAARSNARFDTATPIFIDRDGVRSGNTDADVRSRVRLGGVRTDFDGFPLVEQLVREIAVAQYEQTADTARRTSERLLKSEVQRTVSSEVDQQIDVAASKLTEHLLGPLGRLRLDPVVIDMDTTASRLAIRYRVAGDWQLAAFTPRPRAMSDSLLSMQVHQSMLNNALEQLLPSARPESIRDIVANIRQMFGADASSIPDDIPSDVKVQFAPTRPITIEIEDGRLWLTLRVIRLTDSKDLNLSHFVVRVAYRPEVEGMQARLVRDSVLQISGPRMGMRERFPIRAIFNKVLNENRPLPLVGEQLATHPAAKDLRVGTVELVDGWIGISINPAPVRATGPIATDEGGPADWISEAPPDRTGVPG